MTKSAGDSSQLNEAARRKKPGHSTGSLLLGGALLLEILGIALENLVTRAGALGVGIGQRVAGDFELVAFHFFFVGVLEADRLADEYPFAGGDFVTRHRFCGAVSGVIFGQRL